MKPQQEKLRERHSDLSHNHEGLRQVPLKNVLLRHSSRMDMPFSLLFVNLKQPFQRFQSRK
jgi:hypothetical protein